MDSLRDLLRHVAATRLQSVWRGRKARAEAAAEQPRGADAAATDAAAASTTDPVLAVSPGASALERRAARVFAALDAARVGRVAVSEIVRCCAGVPFEALRFEHLAVGADKAVSRADWRAWARSLERASGPDAAGAVLSALEARALQRPPDAVLSAMCVDAPPPPGAARVLVAARPPAHIAADAAAAAADVGAAPEPEDAAGGGGGGERASLARVAYAQDVRACVCALLGVGVERVRVPFLLPRLPPAAAAALGLLPAGAEGGAEGASALGHVGVVLDVLPPSAKERPTAEVCAQLVHALRAVHAPPPASAAAAAAESPVAAAARAVAGLLSDDPTLRSLHAGAVALIDAAGAPARLDAAADVGGALERAAAAPPAPGGGASPGAARPPARAAGALGGSVGCGLEEEEAALAALVAGAHFDELHGRRAPSPRALSPRRLATHVSTAAALAAAERREPRVAPPPPPAVPRLGGARLALRGGVHVPFAKLGLAAAAEDAARGGARSLPGSRVGSRPPSRPATARGPAPTPRGGRAAPRARTPRARTPRGAGAGAGGATPRGAGATPRGAGGIGGGGAAAATTPRRRSADENADLEAAVLGLAAAPSAPGWLTKAVAACAGSGALQLDGAASGWRAQEVHPLLGALLASCTPRAPMPPPEGALPERAPPPALCGVRCVAIVDVGLTRCPEAVLGAGSALHTLQLAGNALTALPDAGGAAPQHLAAVDLSRNALPAVPPLLLRCAPSLTALDLSANALRALPEGVGALAALRTLSVAHNELAELPRALGRLTELRALDASHNRLVRVPWGLLQAGPDGHGVALRLEGNAAPAAAIRLRARLASAPTVELEVCTAARPSFSLRGERQRYADAAEGIASAVRAHFGKSVRVETNSGALRTVEELQGLSAKQAKAIAAAAEKEAAGSRGATPRGAPPARAPRRAEAHGLEAHGLIRPPPALMPDGCVEQYVSAHDSKLHRYPRVGALQVVVRARAYRTARGAGEEAGEELVGGTELFVPIHSKLGSGKFPSALGVLNGLRHWFGQLEPLPSLDELSLLEGCEEEAAEDAAEEEDEELNSALAAMADRTRSMETVLGHKNAPHAQPSMPGSDDGLADSGAEERRLREAMQAYVIN